MVGLEAFRRGNEGMRKLWNWKHLESAMLRATKKTKENDAYLARPRP